MLGDAIAHAITHRSQRPVRGGLLPHGQVLERELARGNLDVRAWFKMYVPNICQELSLGSPDAPHVEQQVLHEVKRLAARKHIAGDSHRWFADSDSAAFNMRFRHCRMLVCDLVVIVQNCSPYKISVSFDDTVADLFHKFGQGMLVACGILREELMWKVG